MYKVTNTNKMPPGRDFKAKFDGREYSFPTGQAVMLDIEATKHIFGLGMKDKTPILTRHGWCTYERDRLAGMDTLNAFIFEFKAEQYEAPLALVETEAGHGPAPVGQSAAAGGADEQPAAAVAAGPVSKKAA